MTYVDGFVIPLQKNKVAQYRKMARLGAEVWMDHGALDYKECVADDLTALVPDETGKGVQKVPSLFPKLAGLKRGETLVFSYIVYRSKAHRDAVLKRVLADRRMQEFDPADMPVDMARMATAGFKAIVEAGANAPATRRARPKRTVRRNPRRERRLERLPLSGRAF